MRTLHPAYRVSDLHTSLSFYAAVGYRQIGRVDTAGGGSLTMLKLEDDEVVALELVYRPEDGPVFIGNGFSHLAVQVDDLEKTLVALRRRGLVCGEMEHPGGPHGPRTSWLADPDGYRLELVEWPAGHAYGMTEADFTPAD